MVGQKFGILHGHRHILVVHALGTPHKFLRLLHWEILASRRTHKRRNPDAVSFQVIFDLKSLISRANRMQSLVINISFSIEGVIFLSDISKHYDEEFGLTFTRTKFESSVSDLVSDTSAFDFPHISWSPHT